jgi:fructokinase
MSAVIFGEALVDDFTSEQIVGGAPFNVARHLAAFMSQPLMITRIGDDRNGAAVLAEFERFAMNQQGVQVDRMEETGRVVVERGPNGHRFVIPPRQAYDFIDSAAAVKAVQGAAPSIVYFGTLAQRQPVSRDALHATLAATPATRFMDINLRPGQAGKDRVTASLHAADIVKLNEEELQSLFDWYLGVAPQTALTKEEVRGHCAELVRMFELEALLLTLGHRGSVYFGADGQMVQTRDNPVPPYVIDTVGAGDAFSAIFLLGKERGWPLETTLARANAFAGAICTIPGAVPGDLGFYDSWAVRWR